MSETNNSVKSALRTLDILEFVVTRPMGVVAQDIADALSIPVSSLSYLLGTLVERGYLERVGRRYLAGPSLERLRRAPDRQSLADLSRPLIRMLRQKVNETSSLFEPVGWEIEAKVTETAAQSLSYQISVGRRTPMHCTAAGKAFLAALSADELESYLAQTERPRLTETTVCEADALRHELTSARAAGHARTDGDYLLGIAGLGVVVRAQDRPVAAISVALPSVRLLPDHERAIVVELHRTAQALEAMLA